MRNQRGFTLLEVLIAIVITALIGLGSWGALSIAITTNEVTSESTEALRDLQRAMLILSKDIQQVAARPIRNEFGDLEPAVQTNKDFYILEFTKRGWRNPMQDPRSDLQRIAYALEDGEVRRYSWSNLDRAQDAEPNARSLLSSVEALEFKYWNGKSWVDSWPPEPEAGEEVKEINTKTQIPGGISVNLETERYGSINRVFMVSGYLEHNAFPDEENKKGEEEENKNGEEEENGNL